MFHNAGSDHSASVLAYFCKEHLSLVFFLSSYFHSLQQNFFFLPGTWENWVEYQNPYFKSGSTPAIASSWGNESVDGSSVSLCPFASQIIIIHLEFSMLLHLNQFHKEDEQWKINLIQQEQKHVKEMLACQGKLLCRRTCQKYAFWSLHEYFKNILYWLVSYVGLEKEVAKGMWSSCSFHLFLKNGNYNAQSRDTKMQYGGNGTVPSKMSADKALPMTSASWVQLKNKTWALTQNCARGLCCTWGSNEKCLSTFLTHKKRLRRFFAFWLL